MPALRIDQGSGHGEQVRIERIEKSGGEAAPQLGKSLSAGAAYPYGRVVKLGEQRIEFSLHAGAHAADHQGQDPWQRQLALARKGAGEKTMRLDQHRIVQGGGELRKDRSRGEYLSSYSLNIN